MAKLRLENSLGLVNLSTDGSEQLCITRFAIKYTGVHFHSKGDTPFRRNREIFLRVVIVSCRTKRRDFAKS